MTQDGAEPSDPLDQRRAEGIIHALRDEDSTTCSDCGETIDLHGATATMEVIVELEAHRQDCNGEWYDE